MYIKPSCRMQYCKAKDLALRETCSIFSPAWSYVHILFLGKTKHTADINERILENPVVLSSENSTAKKLINWAIVYIF